MYIKCKLNVYKMYIKCISNVYKVYINQMYMYIIYTYIELFTTQLLEAEGSYPLTKFHGCLESLP